MIGSKGDLKQGILGVLTAGFMHPMKAGFNKLIAHGVTGGVRSRLSGGSFKSRFLGSAVSYGASWSGAYEAAGVSSQANTWAQRAQNAVSSYVVGGIAAELGGGKFANGGMSAAFSRMFNDLGYPIGEDFSHSNGKNSHFHDAPLESVTPLLDIFFSRKTIGFAVKTRVGRSLCIFAILCAPPNTIRDGLEDSIRLKNISRKVKDSINVHNRSKK